MPENEKHSEKMKRLKTSKQKIFAKKTSTSFNQEFRVLHRLCLLFPDITRASLFKKFQVVFQTSTTRELLPSYSREPAYRRLYFLGDSL